MMWGKTMFSCCCCCCLCVSTAGVLAVLQPFGLPKMAAATAAVAIHPRVSCCFQEKKKSNLCVLSAVRDSVKKVFREDF